MARRDQKRDDAVPAKKAGTRLSAEERKRKQEGAESGGAKLLGERTKRDIVGVLLIIVAVVLMLCAVLPVQSMSTDGMVTHLAGSALHLVFGVGCYVLPVFLAIIGATFLVRFDLERVPTRAAIGLAIIFIALLGFIALFTPISGINGDQPDLVFAEHAVIAHGGYIGAAIAWCGLMLFGRVIASVILVGVVIIGVMVIGFSISKLIETLRRKKAERAEALRAARASGEVATPFARIRRGHGGRLEGYDAAADGASDALPAPPGITIDILSERGHNRSRTPSGAEGMPLGELASPAASLDPASASLVEQTSALTRPLFDGTTGAPTAMTEDVRPIAHQENLVPIIHAEPEPLASILPVIDGSAPTQRFDAMTQVPAAQDIPWATKDEAAVEVPPETITRKLGKPRPLAQPVTEKIEEAPVPKKERKERAATAQPIAPPVEVELPEGAFRLPPASLLAQASKKRVKAPDSELSATAERLQQTLEDFGIHATVVGWVAGPTVTLFKVDLPSGVRVSRVTALNDDIALALAAPGVRIFAPIPHTNYVGIEVPNQTRQTVLLSEVLEEAEEGPLQVAIGKDVEGNAIVSDLAKMPHLLIGGTTGSGKSVSINAMIMSMLMRATPDEVRFIMVDPKRVEFTPYNGIPHLYVPVVTEPKEAASALSWGVAEMERRLKVFAKCGVRNIGQYNARIESGAVTEESEETPSKMPYIVIIIDELADLMMNVGKEVEFSISRIAQLARAAGIHLIVATQRPSTNVVTGLIKANITNRIAFNVASGIDSRVVLDTPGAENLIGLGDLLLSKPELSKPQRIQGCYVSEDDIEAVVEHLKAHGEPEYHGEILKTNIVTLGASSPDGDGGSTADDPLLWEAADIVVSASMGSTSNIQRRLKVGYARAGRIMDQLEEKGVVGPANGSRPREVLVDAMELETLKAFEANDDMA